MSILCPTTNNGNRIAGLAGKAASVGFAVGEGIQSVKEGYNEARKECATVSIVRMATRAKPGALRAAVQVNKELDSIDQALIRLSTSGVPADKYAREKTDLERKAQDVKAAFTRDFGVDFSDIAGLGRNFCSEAELRSYLDKVKANENAELAKTVEEHNKKAILLNEWQARINNLDSLI